MKRTDVGFKDTVPPFKRRSFFIKCEPPTDQDISLGFRWLFENAEGTQKGLFLAVPSVSFLHKKTIFSTLGERAAKDLETNYRMNFNRIFFRLLTIKNTTYLEQAQSSVILAMFANRPLLEILDRNSRISSILVVPGAWHEIKDWALKWKAIDLATSRPFV